MVSYQVTPRRIETKIGEIYQNKTLKYLVPALNYYGPTLKTKLNLVFKLAFGVFDALLEGSHLEGQRNIYILIDKAVRPELYENFMNWVKHQEYYVTNYSMDELEKGRKQMLVLAFPHQLGDAYDKFLEGKYSKMFQKQEILTFFENKPLAKEVFYRTYEAREKFKVLIKDTFGVELTSENFKREVFEYDLPPDKYEEIFNQ